MLSISLLVLLLSIYFTPLQNIFQFVPLEAIDLTFCFIAGFASVIWIEIFKLIRRRIAIHIETPIKKNSDTDHAIV